MRRPEYAIVARIEIHVRVNILLHISERVAAHGHNTFPPTPPIIKKNDLPLDIYLAKKREKDAKRRTNGLS